MIKNIVRLTLVSYIWKRYRRLIVSTLLLFAYYWLVGKLHGDYIVYRELLAKDLANEGASGEQTPLAYSFFIKWVALIIGGVIYCISNDFLIALNKFKPEKQTELPGKSTREPSTEAHRSEQKEKTKERQSDDPFEHIRAKGKLRSKADIIIEKKLEDK